MKPREPFLLPAPPCGMQPPEHHLGYLLKRLQHRLRQAFERVLAGQGVELSFAALAALAVLAAHPGRSGAQLARDCLVSPQTMHGLLRRMQGDGWVERAAHPDNARIDLWRLTRRGAAVFDRAGTVLDPLARRLDAALGPRERLQFERCIRKLMACLDEARPGQGSRQDAA